MNFDSTYLGAQTLAAEEFSYAGSRYADVRAALFHNAYYETWGAAGEPPLPTFGVTLDRVVKGLWPNAKSWLFRQAAERTVDSRSDMRWGADGRGFRRLLHPNGVCLFGRWIIDEPTEYSGYFRQGSEALIVARYSTCCSETRRGHARSLSMVGKLYPTTDPEHPQLLRTANFITQQDIGGDFSASIDDAVLRNAPNVTPWRRGGGIATLLLTGLLFRAVDREPAIRQLHSIAELGRSDDALHSISTPNFMQLTVAKDDTPDVKESREKERREPAGSPDFRDEVLGRLYDPGDRRPTGRKLIFKIEVTDEGTRRGALVQRWRFNNWKHIGRIEFTEAVASYNGDFVIHFAHPGWRSDRNDPKTAFRARLR